jgi:hypothetical protein
MVDTDAAMATITVAMPKIELADLETPKIIDKRATGSNEGAPTFGGFTASGPPRASISFPLPALPESPATSVIPSAPILTGGVNRPAVNVAGPDGRDPTTPSAIADWGTPARPTWLGLAPPTVAAPSGGTLGTPNASESQGSVARTANPVEPDVARQANTGTPFMAAPASGRPSSTSRPALRPGGRPALWASQRRRKESDPQDPWRVERGGPAVIEAPEPPVHDPGPGVIG